MGLDSTFWAAAAANAKATDNMISPRCDSLPEHERAWKLHQPIGLCKKFTREPRP